MSEHMLYALTLTFIWGACVGSLLTSFLIRRSLEKRK
jgi:hypothetical protein